MGKKSKEEMRAKGTRLFRAWRLGIINDIKENYGYMHSINTDIGDEWRNILPYNPAVEAFVIKQTEEFIKFAVNSKSLKFLKKLINGMADYIACYSFKSGKFATRSDAADELTNKLFYNSNHIKYICEKYKYTHKNYEPENAGLTPKPKKKRPRIQIVQTNKANDFNTAKNAQSVIIVAVQNARKR